MYKPLTIRIILAILLFSIIGYFYYSANYAMHNLPKGELIHEVRSPKNGLSIRIYLLSTALSANAISGELVQNPALAIAKTVVEHI